MTGYEGMAIGLGAYGISELALPTVALLVFYLYLLVRWQHVKRPLCYLIGVVALLAGFFGRFFAIGHSSSVMVVTQVFDCIAAIVAFAAAVGACYGAKLPVVDKPAAGEQTQQPPPQI